MKNNNNKLAVAITGGQPLRFVSLFRLLRRHYDSVLSRVLPICMYEGGTSNSHDVLLFTHDFPSGSFASNFRPPQLCARFLEINGGSCRIGLDLQGVVPLVLQSMSKQSAVHVCINYSYDHRRRKKKKIVLRM